MSGPKLSEIEEVMSSDTYEGWCTYCQEWTHDCCEPDARQYTCPECGNDTCYGAEELLIIGLVDTND